ncbi:MAG TPA: polysaccharide biosynthesis C-terminal domain-containing protein, partial [Pyrinomonadaceae bacterium]|nr:polysaccharide biosynthesis C-terminal domain-containing protein [Pyrinomonadaceae bacterium]
STIYLPILLGYSSLSHTTSTTYISMFSSIFAALTNIGFNILLIPALGLEGCAWATCLMYFVGSLIFALLLKNSADLPISWTFIAMIPAVGGALSFFLTKNPWLSLMICGLISFFVVFTFRHSLKETFLLLKNLRKSA